MTEEKKVTIKIVSEKGHDTKVLPVCEAVQEINTQVIENKKWLFVDGNYVSTDITTSEGKQRLTETLSNAKDIVLTNALIGGSMPFYF